MKKLIVLTTLVFFISVPFAFSRDASREANTTAAKEQATALKKADEKINAVSAPAAGATATERTR